MRRLATAGVLLAAVLVIGSYTPSPAGAKYDSEIEQTTIEGVAETWQEFGTGSAPWKCSEATYSGTQKGTNVGGGIYTSTDLTVHPAFNDCTFAGFPGITASVDTSSCNLTFTPATNGGETGAHAVVDLVSSGEGKCGIKINGILGLCTMVIPEQSNAGVVDFMNAGGSGKTRDVSFAWTLNSLDYEGSGHYCPTSGTDGTLKGSATLKGSSAGNQVGIWVTNS